MIQSALNGADTFLSRPYRDFALDASQTRHWDVIARKLATPSGVPGYFHSPLTRLGAGPSCDQNQGV